MDDGAVTMMVMVRMIMMVIVRKIVMVVVRTIVMVMTSKGEQGPRMLRGVPRLPLPEPFLSFHKHPNSRHGDGDGDICNAWWPCYYKTNVRGTTR